MRPNVVISVETKLDTASWDVGQRFIDSLCQDGGELVPEYVSHNADICKEMYLGAETAKERWAVMYEMRVNGTLYEDYEGFAWRRKSAVKCWGTVKHTSRDFRCRILPGHIGLHSGFNRNVDWYSLLRRWCEIFSPPLGILHYFTGPDLSSRETYYSDFQIGCFPRLVPFPGPYKPEIPNVGWAMVYGDEFAEKVDAERIAAAGFPIEKLGNAYLVRVTENILDVKKDFAYFSRRRAELKKLFPEKFFIIEDEPALP